MSLSKTTQLHPSSSKHCEASIHTNCEDGTSKADVSLPLLTDCSISCRRCVELELKVHQLEAAIEKLTKEKVAEAQNSPIFHSPVQLKGRSERRKLDSIKLSPKQLRYSFDIKEDNVVLQQKLLEIQQRAEKICQKERKEREIIKKIAQQSLRLSGSKKQNEALSKSEISPIKPNHDRLLKLPKTGSIVIEPFSSTQQETAPQKGAQAQPEIVKSGARVLDIPSSVLIDDIPKREGARASILSAPILDSEQIESFLSEDRPKEEPPQKSTEEQMTQDRLSQSMASRRTQKETDEAYNAQMKNSKMAAKFKKKK